MKKISFGLTLLSFCHIVLGTEYPLTVDNCGVSQVFEKAPESIVTMGQAGTEFLYALNQSDKVKGTSVWFTELDEKFKAVNSKIERLADNGPSFEAVIKKRPEMVVVQFPYYVGEKGTVGTREQFSTLGIHSYLLPSSCLDKTDALDSNKFSPDVIYFELRQLAAILNVEAQGEALVAELQQKEQSAKEKAKHLSNKQKSVLFWFSSAKENSDAWVAGKRGVPQYLADTLGLDNIITVDDEWPAVSWEAIAKENPSIIVVAKMNRRRNEMDDYHKKIEFLKNDPVTSQIDAVKNNQIIVIDSQAMDPTLHIFSGLENLVDRLLKE